MTQPLSEQDLSIFSDLHKDVFGVRPRFDIPQTRAEYEARMDTLAAMLADERAREEEEARAHGFANHAVWFWFWANQEELLMDIDAFGPSAHWCPIRHDAGAGEPDDPAADDLPSGCAKSRCAAERWYAGAF
jgi:hypothetical protein